MNWPKGKRDVPLNSRRGGNQTHPDPWEKPLLHSRGWGKGGNENASKSFGHWANTVHDGRAGRIARGVVGWKWGRRLQVGERHTIAVREGPNVDSRIGQTRRPMLQKAYRVAGGGGVPQCTKAVEAKRPRAEESSGTERQRIIHQD